MATALTPLANITTTGSVYNITFSSISGLYKDLILVMTPKSGTGAEQWEMTINNDGTSANYSSVYMRGTGSTASSATITTRPAIRFAATGVLNGTAIAHIMDYSATDKHKTVLVRTDDANYGTEAHVGRWASTAAITSIKISSVNWAMAAGATFALYGVSA